MKKWSKEYDCCIWCLTTDAPHNGHGLCTRCYKHIFIDTSFNERHRKWTKKDIELIMLHKVPDKDLSKLLHRSVSAIQSKRYEIKRKRVRIWIGTQK